MMAKPWAKATAMIPLRPAPPPTTAAAPAPMNTNEKVPINSARSLGAIRLDIVDSRVRLSRAARSGLRQGQRIGLKGRRHGARRRLAKRAALLGSDRLRFEVDAQRLRDAGAIVGIGPIAMHDLPRDDLGRHAFHRSLVVMEQLLLLVGRHQPEQVSGLTVIIVAVAVIVAVGIARDFQRRLAKALVLHRTVERVRLVKGIRIWVTCEPHGPLGVVSARGA